MAYGSGLRQQEARGPHRQAREGEGYRYQGGLGSAGLYITVLAGSFKLVGVARVCSEVSPKSYTGTALTRRAPSHGSSRSAINIVVEAAEAASLSRYEPGRT